MNEIHSLMSTDSGGVIIYEGDAASQLAQFDEWLRTPVNSIWGMPGWGQTLKDFKHEPPGNSTEIGIEAALMTKIRTDIPDVKLLAIRCNSKTGIFDLWEINFVFPFGSYTAKITSEGIAQ